MPSATRAWPVLGRRAPGPVVIHSAPLVLPVSADPLRDGAIAVRGDRVLRVGPRAELLGFFSITEERRWPGVITPGLVDASGAGPSAGVTTRAAVVADLADLRGLPDVSYVRVTSASVDSWEERDRDALITAIHEVDQPCTVGIAALSHDLQVLEEVAVLARTFGLRLLVDLDLHSLTLLDEAGILGPHCHVTFSRPLDPGERKLLRLRNTVATLCPPPPEDALTMFEESNGLALGGGDLFGLAGAILASAAGRTPPIRDLARRLVETATLGGARALGMAEGPGRIGSLGPGSRADLAIFAAGGRHPYAALLDGAPCLGTVLGGTPY